MAELKCEVNYDRLGFGITVEVWENNLSAVVQSPIITNPRLTL